jgi:hypothetical protein
LSFDSAVNNMTDFRPDPGLRYHIQTWRVLSSTITTTFRMVAVLHFCNSNSSVIILYEITLFFFFYAFSTFILLFTLLSKDLLLLSFIVTGFFSSLVLLPLSQWWTPPLRLQVSACSTFLMMCDVPSMAVFCKESIECCPGIVSRYYIIIIIIIIIIISIMLFSYHRFSFPWYFSWANGEHPPPPNSRFNSQLVALFLWCVMFLVRGIFRREFI